MMVFVGLKIKEVNMDTKIATKLADKAFEKIGLGGEITKEKVAKSCKMLFPLLNTGAYPLGMAVAEINKSIVKEIDTLKTKGMNDDEVVEFYWSIPEFQKVWARLHLDKDYLINLVK